MYLEESYLKRHSKIGDRHVFNIDVASKLFCFHINQSIPHINPYFTCMLSYDHLNLSENFMTGGIKKDGIVDIVEFKRRLNVFISGDEKINLLEDLNWDNMVITGGCMAAILPVYNPLMKYVENNNIHYFFDTYYHDADIDVACNQKSVIKYIEDVIEMKNKITKNVEKHFKIKSETKIIPSKSLSIHVNLYKLKKKCQSRSNAEDPMIPYDFDYIMENKNNLDVKFFFYNIYLNVKKLYASKNIESIGNNINDPCYFEYIKYTDYDNVTVLINNYGNDMVETEFRNSEYNNGIKYTFIVDSNLKDVPTASVYEDVLIYMIETVKYKIESPHLKHNFECFRLNNENFFSSISSFHLPCVRSLYNGTTCYMLPSAITAYMTMINIDFKYFVGSKDPIKILNKYRQRGYATLLNKTELNTIKKYAKTNLQILEMYFVNTVGVSDDEKKLKQMFGFIMTDMTMNNFFKPNKTTKYKFIPQDKVTTMKKFISTYVQTNITRDLCDASAINWKTGELNKARYYYVHNVYESLNEK
jgi:hypothetical protein